MTNGRTTYSFGPLERRGLLGPVTFSQAALLTVAALMSVAALDALPSAAGLLIAATGPAVALALTVVPVGGRCLLEWAGIALRFAAGRRRRHRIIVPALPFTCRVRGRSIATESGPPPVPPPGLQDVRLVAAGYGSRAIGALAERGGRRLTAVIACRVGAFALLDGEAQERRLAGWGALLASTGGSAIRRLAWVERTAPAPGDEMARWLHAERDPGLPLRGTAMIDSYLELISGSARATQDHEVMLALQIDAPRGGDMDTAEVLVEQAERVAHGLQSAEVSVLGALGPRQLSQLLRTSFDPYARAELAVQAVAPLGGGGSSELNAWPVAFDENWDSVRADGALHATYWIAGWPRIEVPATFMDSLLGRSTVVRTVAVTFEALSAARSTREVEAAITRDRADRDLRARLGQSETARQRQAAEAARRRESELAAGHAEVRFSGFVTASGRDEQELRLAEAELLEHAARARLELRRLYGQQAEAFTFTLPLCRGLR